MVSILNSISGNAAWAHIEIDSVDDELRLKQAHITESLSEPSVASITIVSRNPNLATDALLGLPAVIRIDGTAGHPGRHYHGHISSVSQTGHDRNDSHYTLTIESSIAFMRKRHNVRIYQQHNEIQIIKSLLDEHTITDVEFQLMGTYAERDYCVQYNESDLSFMQRLMSEAGIYSYISHSTDKHTVVYSDHPNAHTDSEQATIAYTPATGQRHDEGIITSINNSHSIKTDTASVSDYQFKKPTLSLYTEKTTATKTSGLESYSYPGSHSDPSSGNRQANNRSEAQQHDQTHVQGKGTAKSMTAGYSFTLDQHPNSDSNKKYLVTQSEHTIQQPQVLREEASSTKSDEYSNSFKAIDATTQYRTLPRQKPTVNGVQTAIVTGPEGEEIYVDEHARVKVRFHWDRQADSKGHRNEKSSCWIRVGQSWAGNGFGAVAIPRIGQEVIVDFINGDPDRPIITGSVYHGTNRPPYALPEHKTRTVFKTDTHKGEGYNEIRIEDERELEEIYIHAQKDQNNVVNNDETTSVGHDRTEDVGNDEQQTIGHDRSIATGNDESRMIGNDQSTTINRDNHIQIDRNRQITIEKDLIEKINNHKKQSTFANHWRETGGDYAHKVKGKHNREIVGKTQNKTNTHIITASKELTLKAPGGSITIDSSGITLKGNFVKFKANATSMTKGSSSLKAMMQGRANTGQPLCIPCEMANKSGKLANGAAVAASKDWTK